MLVQQLTSEKVLLDKLHHLQLQEIGEETLKHYKNSKSIKFIIDGLLSL